MAKTYLDSGDTNFRVANTGTTVYGQAGTENIIIDNGVTGIITDQNVERVDLPGAAADFTYQQQGNQMLVYSSGTLLATIPLQGDADGTQVVFTDGSVAATLVSGVMSLGGATVSSTAGAVTPTTIDTSVTSQSTTPTPSAATFSIANVTQDEGNTGTTAYTFTVSLSSAPGTGESVTVDYATADSSATAASGDYTAATGTLTFAAGVTSQTFTVNVTGDTTFEADENFTVNLSNATGTISGVAPTIGTSSATGTITNDDQQGQALTLTTGTDVLSGSTANDNFTAATQTGVQTLGNTDQLNGLGGGADEDTLFANITTATTTPNSIQDIETIQLNASTAATVDFTNVTGFTTLENVQSSAALTVTNIMSAPGTLTGGLFITSTGANNSNFRFADSAVSGSSDSVIVTLDGVVGNNTITVGGTSDQDGDIEALTIKGQGAASDLGTGQIDMEDVTTVNIMSSVNLDLGTTASFNSATTIDGSSSSGNLTFTLVNPGSAATDQSVKTGSGNDSLGFGNLNANSDLTADAGGGNDSITVTAANIQNDWRVEGGSGTDTLIVDDDIDQGGSVDATQEFTGFEALSFSGANAIVQDLDNLDSDIVTITQNVTGGNAVTLTNVDDGDNIRLVEDNAADTTLQGDPGSNTITVTLDDDTAGGNGVAIANLKVNANIEKINLVANGGTAEAHVMPIDTSTTVTEVVITGNAASVDLDDNAGVDGGAGTAFNAALVNIDASGFEGAIDVTMGNTQTQTIVKGGQKADFIELDDATNTNDMVTGGAGSDTINLDNGATNTIQNVVYVGPNDGGDGLADGSTTTLDEGDIVTNFNGGGGATDDNVIIDASGFSKLTGDGATVSFINADNAGIADIDFSSTTSVFVLDENVAGFLSGNGNYKTLANLQTVLSAELSNVQVGDQAIFVISEEDGAGEFGVYLFTATDTDANLDADEISLLGKVTTDADVVAADFLLI